MSSTASAHKSKKHAPGSNFDPVVCIPEEERTKKQISHDKMVNNIFHRLSKLQQDCAIYEIEQLKIAAFSNSFSNLLFASSISISNNSNFD